jgi:hypothetical protein
MTRLPPGEQWLLRRVEPGEPFREAVDIEGHGVVACKVAVVPGTHPFTAAGANADPGEGEHHND